MRSRPSASQRQAGTSRTTSAPSRSSAQYSSRLAAWGARRAMPTMATGSFMSTPRLVLGSGLGQLRAIEPAQRDPVEHERTQLERVRERAQVALVPLDDLLADHRDGFVALG